MDTQESLCPFCLKNQLLEAPVLAESANGYLIHARSYPNYYLIIPRQHVEHIHDLPDDWMQDIKQLIAYIPKLTHFNISLNIGRYAGQTVKHLHFWIVPRTDDHTSGKGLAALIKLANTI